MLPLDRLHLQTDCFPACRCAEQHHHGDKSAPREKLHDIGFGNDFLNVTSKAEVTKEDKTNWTLSELKSASKDTINSVKKQPYEWEKICANYPMKISYLQYINS